MTGVVELIEDVLDSQEKDGFLPLNEKRFLRMERAILVWESDEATRSAALTTPPLHASVRLVTATHSSDADAAADGGAASVRRRSSGVINSDIVPEITELYKSVSLTLERPPMHSNELLMESVIITDADALALGARHLEDGVVTNEHGRQRRQERDQ